MGRDIVNEFSWSKSRHEKFRECLRAYFFHYYGSWGGWEDQAADEVRELYTLKKLSNRFTWSGNAVHEAIRDTLLDIQSGRGAVPERSIERTRLRMREDFRQSRRKDYRNRRQGNLFRGLAEHEYGEDIPREEWTRTWDAAETALKWFYSSRWVALAKSLKPSDWVEVDVKDFDNPFLLNGVRFYGFPDFVYRDPNGEMVVVDWKTGKVREGYDEQVVGYAVYLATRYRLPIEKIRATLVYLNEGVEVDVRLTADAAKSFDAYFAKSVGGMRDLLQNPEKNVARPKDAFPMTENLATCAYCVFRRNCGRGSSASAPAAVAAS